MSNLEKKMVEFSPLKGFWPRLDREMTVWEGLGVCELRSVRKLLSKAQRYVNSVTIINYSYKIFLNFAVSKEKTPTEKL